MGEIIPIIYHQEYPDFVIFRIGRRGYYFCDWISEGDSTSQHIGTLPKSFDEFFKIDGLEDLLRNRRKGDLDLRCGDGGLGLLLQGRLRTLEIFDFINTEEGRLFKARNSIGEVPELWRGMDWLLLRDAAHDRKVKLARKA